MWYKYNITCLTSFMIVCQTNLPAISFMYAYRRISTFRRIITLPMCNLMMASFNRPKCHFLVFFLCFVCVRYLSNSLYNMVLVLSVHHVHFSRFYGWNSTIINNDFWNLIDSELKNLIYSIDSWLSEIRFYVAKYQLQPEKIMESFNSVLELNL